MAEGIYGIKCPKCGQIYNYEYQQSCTNCKEKLYPRVKAKYHKQEEIQQADTTISTSQDIKSQVQSLTPERSKATIRLESVFPKLYCESNPNFLVEIRDRDVIGREGIILKPA